jgi:hypothetical protein
MNFILGVADVTGISGLAETILPYGAAGLALAGVVLGVKLVITWVKSFGKQAAR